MSLEKTAGFFKDARTIWIGVLSIITILAWAGDTRWMLKDDVVKITSVIEIQNLSQRNDELEVQKVYESDPNKVKMIDALININKNKIKTIVDKESVK